MSITWNGVYPWSSKDFFIQSLVYLSSRSEGLGLHVPPEETQLDPWMFLGALHVPKYVLNFSFPIWASVLTLKKKIEVQGLDLWNPLLP